MQRPLAEERLPPHLPAAATARRAELRRPGQGAGRPRPRRPTWPSVLLRSVGRVASRPCRCASAAASTRPATPSLARMFDTCTLAVFGLMKSAVAIWPLDRPGGHERQHFALPVGQSERRSRRRRTRGVVERRPAPGGPAPARPRAAAARPSAPPRWPPHGARRSPRSCPRRRTAPHRAGSARRPAARRRSPRTRRRRRPATRRRPAAPSRRIHSASVSARYARAAGDDDPT